MAKAKSVNSIANMQIGSKAKSFELSNEYLTLKVSSQRSWTTFVFLIVNSGLPNQSRVPKYFEIEICSFVIPHPVGMMTLMFYAPSGRTTLTV